MSSDARGGRSPSLRLAALLLERLVAADHFDAVLGDLEQGARRRRPPVRQLWLVRQSFSFLIWSLADRRARRVRIPTRRATVSFLAFELRGALRALTRAPGYSLAMVLTLTLGIAGTTTVFALVHGVLLAPLPYPNAERLDAVWPTIWASKALFRDVEERVRSYERLGAWSGGARVVRGGGDPELLLGPEMSAGLLEALGYTPEHGRFLETADGLPGAPPVVVLTRELFEERFGGDPALVGTSIEMDAGTAIVVGVLPAGASLLQPDARLVTPLRFDPALREYRTSNYLRIVGLRAEGLTGEEASADVARVGRTLQEEYQLSDTQAASAGVVSLHEFLVGDRRPLLALLMGAVGIVLLIVCVNAGSLTLARQLARGREVALRKALGCGRLRGLVGLAAESLLLAAAGGAVGTLLAWWILAGLRAGHPIDLPRLAEVGVDLPVVAFATGVSLLAALVAGVVPALRAGRLDAGLALRSATAVSAGTGTRLARELLVGVEVALAVVLAAAAGLMAHSLWSLTRVELGLEPDHRLLVQLVPPAQGPDHALEVGPFYDRVIAALEALPEVEAAGSINSAPVRGGGWVMGTEIEGQEYESSADMPLSYWRVVSPGYFAAAGTPVRRGRSFTDTDEEGGEPVAIVNETLARRHWGGDDPVGRRLRIGWDSDAWLSVVGVVADVRHLGVGVDTPPTVYRPLRQAAPVLQRVGVSSQSLVVHTRPEPLAALPAIREAIRDVDAGTPLVGPSAFESVVRESLAEPRLLLQVLAFFGIAGLSLAAVGIAGVVSHVVRARRRELGVRQALGASPSSVVGRSLGRGMLPGLLGLAFGTALAIGLGPLVSDFLFEVPSRDPLTLGAVVAVLLGVVTISAWLPSRRAARIDPAEALRAE